MNLPPRDAIVIGVQATHRDTLEYQPPSNRRRRALARIVILSLLSAAVGIVAMLCWRKFGRPIELHLAIRQAQRELLTTPIPTGSIDWTFTEVGPLESSTARSAREQLRLNSWRYEGLLAPIDLRELAWAGVLHTAHETPRLIIVRCEAGFVGPDPSCRLVLAWRVFELATALHGAQLLRSGTEHVVSGETVSIGPLVTPADRQDAVEVPYTAHSQNEGSPTSAAGTLTLVLRNDDTMAVEPPPMLHSSTTGSN